MRDSLLMSGGRLAEPHTIDVGVCERLVDAATKSCHVVAQPAVPISAPQPEWDALASSLAGIGLGIAWGGTVLAIIALIAGIAWAKLLRDVARQEAKKCAEELMEKWLAEEAPQILSRMNATMSDASIGDTDDTLAADQMGEGA